MITGQVGQWLAEGALDLPLPGAGDTVARWRRLAALAESDIVAGRLAEAHADATAILAELGGPAPSAGQLWGVWAAEPPGAVLRATKNAGRWTVNGTKEWCSGAGICTHALVTAHTESGDRPLFAVDLLDPGIQPQPSDWHNPGMAESDTRAVRFDAVAATEIGASGEYLSRPGFWHGAIGVAACWVGGARAVAAPLYRRCAKPSADPHTLAHLGAVDAALIAAEATLMWAAGEIDADPLDRKSAAELIARRVRAVAETAVEAAVVRTGRALGPAPLCTDEIHAKRVADLTVYVRQSHAERDLERLGSLSGSHR
jgi:alkylation response protein AidB-like acyl-CoA dehydrogenase